MTVTHKAKYAPGQHISQFRIKRVEYAESVKAMFYELVHEPTGAKYIHLACEDDNNVFSIAFRTIPEDSTGVAHILEHSVLEGSEKFPVRIYKNLTGRSLNSFLNAMTSADYTAYPLASRNKKDFFNLMECYLDAALFPLLLNETFLQEGWRYEFAVPDDPETPLMFKGVVYNEMKGALGNPLRLFHEKLKKAVFPDLTYAYVSGGDPQVIPELTYENWRAFHRKHYHPSNAFIFTYGDIPLADLIEAMEIHALSRFDKSDPVPPVPEQPMFSSPREVRSTYPVPKEADISGKSMVALAWKLAPVTEFYENLKLSLLSEILTSDSSSILNRALLKSGLGSGLLPVGFIDSFSESIWGSGLKDCDEKNADRIETLILDTLKNVAEAGIDRDEVEAAIHQFEFFTREIKGDHGFPFGLSLCMRGLDVWKQGGDFFKTLTLDTHLENLRREALGDGFFRTLIHKYFLDNPHRVKLILTPDQGGVERQEAALRTRLDQFKSKLTQSEIQALLEQAEKLKAHQDQEEDLSCMPSITLDDISREPDFTEYQTGEIVAGEITTPIYEHPMVTNGILYLELGFATEEIDCMACFELSLLNLLPSLGAGGKNYVEMGRKIKMRVGSVGLKTIPLRHVTTGQIRVLNLVSARCLPRNQAEMADIVSDMLLNPDFEDTKRLTELVKMKRSYALPTAAAMGHRMAFIAASRWLSRTQNFYHETDGLGFFQRLLQFRKNIEMPRIATQMKSILNSFVYRNLATSASTGPGNMLGEFRQSVGNILERLPVKSEQRPAHQPAADSALHVKEAWIINTEVSYIAKAIPVVPYEHADAPALKVISQLLERPLYSRIRAKGGAYGAFAVYNSDAGVFAFMTFRDPHTAESLDAFDAAVEEIASGNFTQEKLDEAIIETIRVLDLPSSPRGKGLDSYLDILRGRSPEVRRKHRAGILSVTRDAVIRVMDTYFSRPLIHGVAIVTSDDILRRSETRRLDLERISLIGESN